MIKKEAVSYTLILTFLVVMAVALSLSSTSLGLETAWADSVIKNIHVDDTPSAVAFDSANGYTYVTNADLGIVSVIDGSTNTVIKDIHVGSHSLTLDRTIRVGYL